LSAPVASSRGHPRLVGWLKECRRLFARYEKTAINFLGFIKMGFVHYYLRLFCPE